VPGVGSAPDPPANPEGHDARAGESARDVERRPVPGRERGGREVDAHGEDELTGQEVLDQLGERLSVGAVFRVEDRSVMPPSDSDKSHPYVILGGLPQPTDSPDEAVARRVIVSWRESWKPDLHGPLPTTHEEETRLLETRKSVFSRRGTLKGCERDGLFSVTKKRLVLIRHLARCPFLGWLPKPAIDWLLARAVGARAPDPYPPDPSSPGR
jgi:hypothetical protein